MSKVYFDITVDHDEMATLETALSQYLAVCERELANGVYSPFSADQDNIKRILWRRHDKVHTRMGLLSGKQIEEMARAGQLSEDFFNDL
jgi:hypothetical protein